MKIRIAEKEKQKQKLTFEKADINGGGKKKVRRRDAGWG